MDANQIECGQIEINDLIGDAVNNAVARRSQAINSDEALLTLSEEETKNLMGGYRFVPWIILGLWFEPQVLE